MATRAVSKDEAAIESALVQGGNFTLKFGDGFSAPWMVIQEGNADANIAYLLKLGGKTQQEIEEAKLAGKVFDLIAEVVAAAQLTYGGKLVEKGLGGKPASSPPWDTSSSGSSSRSGGRGRSSVGSRPPVPAADKPAEGAGEEENPNAGILAEIAEAADRAALQVVYARNKAAFTQEQKDGKDELRAAFTAKLAAAGK